MMPLSGAAVVVARAVALLVVLTLDGGRVTPAPPASSEPAPVARDGTAALSRLDGLDQRRDDPATFAEAHRLATEALAAAPLSYEALWRAARETFSETDQPHRSPDERSRLGKAAYDLAERAIAVNPNGVAGYYWATLGIGRHAETMGVVRALAN